MLFIDVENGMIMTIFLEFGHFSFGDSFAEFESLKFCDFCAFSVVLTFWSGIICLKMKDQ